MADKAISELAAASSVGSLDLFVLEQSGTAKKLTGQILENWLVSFADGHGGIQTIEKTGTSGLVDTYTITLADETEITFTVTNGKGISSIAKTATSGLKDTYTVTYNDTTSFTYDVTNGKGITSITWSESGTTGDGKVHTGTIAYNDGTSSTITITDGYKGDTGAQTYVFVKYSATEPTSDSDMGDNPDDWMGIYSGLATSASSLHYTDFDWYKIKGETGNTGAAASITSQAVEYQASSSGTTVPSGTWTTTIPSVSQGDYLWTRTTLNFNDNTTTVSYSVGYIGEDGTGTGDMKKSDYDTNNTVLTAGGIPSYVQQEVTSAVDVDGLTAATSVDDTDVYRIKRATTWLKITWETIKNAVKSLIADDRPIHKSTSLSTLPTTVYDTNIDGDMICSDIVIDGATTSLKLRWTTADGDANNDPSVTWSLESGTFSACTVEYNLQHKHS